MFEYRVDSSTARILTLPVLAAASALAIEMKTIEMWPAITSCIAGATPR
jgi:hypothetical protein